MASVGDDVSARMFHFYVELASVHGVPAEQLTAGLPSAPRLLAHDAKWYSWDEHVDLLERFERLMGGPDAAEQAMRRGAYRRVVRPFNALVSFLTTAKGVYWAGFRWFAPALFRHLRFHYEELSSQCIRGTVVIPDGYRDCPSFLRAWAVSMRAAPLNIGLPESDVEVVYGPRRAVYTIRLPARRRIFARLWQWLRAVFRSADVVDEVARHQQELKEAYESLLAAHQTKEAALRASEQAQRALLAAMPDLVLRLGPDGRVVDVGGGGTSAHPLAELLGVRPGAPLEGPAELYGELRAHIAATLATGAVQCFELPSSQDGTRPSTEWRTAQLDEGSVVCVVRDLSEKKQLERQLVLSDRLAALGTLAASVAHEINNPLASILVNLEVAQRALSSPKAAGLVQDALESGERIRDIVAELRTLSRPDERPVVRVDVNSVVASVLRVTAHSLRHRVRVETSLGRIPPVLANEGRLGQVLVNLLVNAAQAMPRNDVQTNCIRVRTRSVGAQVHIEVEDNGKGMPAHVLAHVFDPYFTTKASGEGTGLGLAICQRIVTDLGGQLEVHSEVDQGSVFRVVLPAATGLVHGAPESGKHDLRRSSTSHSSRRRILIIDDNPKVAQSLKLLLDAHEVTLANGGAEGLERLLQEPYDVALCDLMMPEVDGVELFRRVQEERPGLERRIVFMTGGAFTADARSFLESVPNRYLEKPFRPEQLEKAIQDVH